MSHFIAWIIYITAACGFLGILWRLTAFISFYMLRLILLILAASLLLTPWTIAEYEEYYAPAFMVAFFEAFLRTNSGDPLPSLIAMGSSFLIGLVLALGIFLFLRRQ